MAVSTKTLHPGGIAADPNRMRCRTCRGDVLFKEGKWKHLRNTKCAAVVVEWPKPLLGDED